MRYIIVARDERTPIVKYISRSGCLTYSAERAAVIGNDIKNELAYWRKVLPAYRVSAEQLKANQRMPKAALFAVPMEF